MLSKGHSSTTYTKTIKSFFIATQTIVSRNTVLNITTFLCKVSSSSSKNLFDANDSNHYHLSSIISSKLIKKLAAMFVFSTISLLRHVLNYYP